MNTPSHPPTPTPSATPQQNNPAAQTQPPGTTAPAPFQHENDLLAGMDLGQQCQLPLPVVIAELVPLPGVQILAQSLTALFQAVEKSKVNKEQWKLLQGRCVMVTRIANARVKNNGGERYVGLEAAAGHLRETINHITERICHYNDTNRLLALVEARAISEEIQRLFCSLDGCLVMFKFGMDVAQNQWIHEFTAVRQNELAQLEQLRGMLDELKTEISVNGQKQEVTAEMTIKTYELLREIRDENLTILQDQSKTSASTFADAQQIVQTIQTVTDMQLPMNLLSGRQCIVDSSIPIKTGLTCDIYSASFLTNEKVAKKVFRLGTSEEERVRPYAEKFVRNAQLWANLRCDYTLPFYGIGMEAFDGNKHFQLYMLSPLMKNLDAVTYLKKHRNNPNMKGAVMRIITDAARGLQYLHNRDPPVAHCGMRGDNILITDSGGGMLGGFGLTKALQDGRGQLPQAVMTGRTESQRWMPPELLGDLPALQTPADIWGWAMAALEIISGRVPFYDMLQSYSVQLGIGMGKRPVREMYPEFEQYAIEPNAMWTLLERCWTEPEKRPTIDDVVYELKQIAKK